MTSPCEVCEVNPATYTILGHHHKSGRPTYQHICHPCKFGGIA